MLETALGCLKTSVFFRSLPVMLTDCLPLFSALEKTLSTIDPTFALPLTWAFPAHHEFLGSDCSAGAWLPNTKSSTHISSAQPREIALGPCLRTPLRTGTA